MPWDFKEEKKKQPSGLGQKKTETVVTNTDGSQYNMTSGEQTRPPSTVLGQSRGLAPRSHGWQEAPHLASGYLEAKVEGLQSLLGGEGWPQGAIIGVTGIGKTGKTTCCLQEAMLQAAEGQKVLYVYNESPRARFMKIANKHRDELGFSMEQLANMSFYDLSGSTLQNPQPSGIERYAQGFILKELLTQMKNQRPSLIVIDSLTKLCRLYPAQAYYFIQQITRGLWEGMDTLGLYPVVLCIMQKSGGHWEETDATVLGGHGVGHELDGMIVFTREPVDTWKARELGLDLGSTLRLIRIDSLRDVDTDDSAHLLIKQGGRLKIGPSPETMRLEKIAMDLIVEEAKKKAKAKTRKGKE